MLGVAYVAKVAGLAYWPSAAIAGLVYSSLATFVSGRAFGLVASDWILRMLHSMPGTRRLLSSRTENA